LLDAWLPFDRILTHTVMMNLATLRLLDVRARAEVSVAWTPEDEAAVARTRAAAAGGHAAYAVLHPCARFAYKAWRLDGWVKLCEWLRDKGMHIYVTGG